MIHTDGRPTIANERAPFPTKRSPSESARPVPVKDPDKEMIEELLLTVGQLLVERDELKETVRHLTAELAV